MAFQARPDLPPGGVMIKSEKLGNIFALSFVLVTRRNEVPHIGRLSCDIKDYRDTLAPILRIAAKNDPRIHFEEDVGPTPDC